MTETGGIRKKKSIKSKQDKNAMFLLNKIVREKICLIRVAQK